MIKLENKKLIITISRSLYGCIENLAKQQKTSVSKYCLNILKNNLDTYKSVDTLKENKKQKIKSSKQKTIDKLLAMSDEDFKLVQKLIEKF